MLEHLSTGEIRQYGHALVIEVQNWRAWEVWQGGVGERFALGGGPLIQDVRSCGKATTYQTYNENHLGVEEQSTWRHDLERPLLRHERRWQPSQPAKRWFGILRWNPQGTPSIGAYCTAYPRAPIRRFVLPTVRAPVFPEEWRREKRRVEDFYLAKLTALGHVNVSTAYKLFKWLGRNQRQPGQAY
ncbi:MAG: hypothetical protein Q8R28_19005 [Dehalococcoidia bacterium]|nr:hypothetical protein [Dehalococcoidia bacterium]